MALRIAALTGIVPPGTANNGLGGNFASNARGLTVFAWMRRTGSDAPRFSLWGANTRISAGINAATPRGVVADSAGVTLSPQAGSIASLGLWVPVALSLKDLAGTKRAALCATPDGAAVVATSTTLSILPGVLNSVGIGRENTTGTLYAGDFAHGAVWDAALDDNDLRALCAGANPLAIRRDALQAYFPLEGDLRNLVPGGFRLLPNVDALSWTDGPTILPPPRRRPAWLLRATNTPTTVYLTAAGAANFTVPAGVTSLDKVETWSGAGSGGNRGSQPATGGGGGAYSAITGLAVTPGQVIAYQIGAGGASQTTASDGLPGGDTWFGSTSTVLAKGGAGGLGNGTGAHAGGQGGQASAGVGSIRFGGGNGGSGTVGGSATGGGGSATPNGDGAAGTNTTSAVATNGGAAGTGGGAGGLAATPRNGNAYTEGGGGGAGSIAASTNGGTGGFPGGGGGAIGGSGDFSGPGAGGQIRITYSVGSAAALSGSVAGTSTVTGTLTGTGSLAGSLPGVSTVGGTLTGAGRLVGAVPGVSTLSATLSGIGALAGQVPGTSAAAGALSGLGSLAGQVPGVSTLAGTLTNGQAFAGTVSGVSTVTGTLTGLGRMVGALPGVSTVAGALGGTAAAAGVIPAGSTVAGVLSGLGGLAGVLSGVSMVAGTLRGTGALAGQVPAVSVIAGQISNAGRQPPALPRSPGTAAAARASGTPATARAAGSPASPRSA
jgi:hypothetical protein